MKYNSKKTEYNGIKFDSKAEAEYYIYLEKKKALGLIEDFNTQVKFELQPSFKKNGVLVRAITYTVDYEVIYANRVEYIDIKGMETQQGILRKKMFDYKYPTLELKWICKSIKYGVDGWIESDELKKIRKANKKQK